MDKTFQPDVKQDKGGFDHTEFMMGGSSPEVKLFKRRATENLLIANKYRAEGNPHLAVAYDTLYQMHRDTAKSIEESENIQ